MKPVLSSRFSVLGLRLSVLRGKLASHLWLGVFAVFLLTGSSVADVLKVVVNDAIQPVTAEYIARALEAAAANHDQA
ncbi:MAG TPA: hypothetical protein VEK84_08770, partial [Terriglobales bacterium]|nr:hypothetical protein [Terriglobales bacterium]